MDVQLAFFSAENEVFPFVWRILASQGEHKHRCKKSMILTFYGLTLLPYGPYGCMMHPLYKNYAKIEAPSTSFYCASIYISRGCVID